MYIFRVLIVLCCFGMALPVSGQYISDQIDPADSTQLVALRTQRGDVLIGRLKHLSPDSVVLQIEKTIVLAYTLAEVDWLGPVAEAHWLSGDYDSAVQESAAHGYENLVYSPTGFTHARGRGEYQNSDLIYNIADYGLSDQVSIGGGVVLPPILMLRLKAAFVLSPTVRTGMGTNTFFSLERDFGGVASHYYGVLSLGPPSGFFNLTIGPLTDYESELGPVLITAGGSFTFATHWRAVLDVGFELSEPLILPNILVSYSRRRNRFAAGLLGIPDADIPIFPLLRYARRF